jgi:hypothetical protein
LYDLQFGEGTNAGQTGGFGIAMRTVANVNNFCRFSLGVSTSWAGALGCAGTYSNAPFNFLNPIYINPGSTTAPNIDIATASGFMTGTVPMFRIRANSSAGACPSGGCGLFVSSDGAFAGYLALFDFNGARKFGIKPSGLEFFGNTLYPITAVPGTGVNLLRSIGALNNGNLAAFDANNNAVDSGLAISNTCQSSGSGCSFYHDPVHYGATITSGTTFNAGTCGAVVGGGSAPSWWTGNSAVTFNWITDPGSAGGSGLIANVINTGSAPGWTICNLTASNITTTAAINYSVTGFYVPVP